VADNTYKVATLCIKEKNQFLWTYKLQLHFLIIMVVMFMASKQ